MERAKGIGAEHLALATAAAVVYQQIMGSAANGDKAEEALDRVAGAIANVAPIYTADRPSGAPRQLAPIELIHRRFELGAALLRTSFGLEYRNLSIRADMRSAVAILKGARVSFRAQKP
ncbi:MAG: hypothetical protein ACT4P3_20385 [Betaproteobacteria bacterium]